MLIAKRLDDSACEPATLSPLPQPSQNSSGSGGGSAPNSSTTVVVEQTTVVTDTQPVEVGCGSSAPGRDPDYDDNQSSGCSSDTSSSKRGGFERHQLLRRQLVVDRQQRQRLQL